MPGAKNRLPVSVSGRLLDEGAVLQFRVGLLQFRPRVHDDGPVPGDGFFDGLARHEALSTAMQTNRALWFNGLDDADDATWVEYVVRRYLSRTHRDGSAEGCPLPALSAEVSRESGVVRAAYEAELRKTVMARRRRRSPPSCS